MKKASYIFATLASIFFTSCQSEIPFDFEPESKGVGITFHISSPLEDSGAATRGDESREQLVNLRYLLADEHGKVVTHCRGCLSDACDRLDINGLKEGDYSIVFFGSSSRSSLARIDEPATLDDAWLFNTSSTLPMGGSCFIKKLDFSVGPDFKPMDYEVVLDRAMSRINVEFPGIPAAVESMISSVTITLDEGSHVFSTIKGDGSYAGEATISNYEMMDSTFRLSFTTLPSTAPLSGTVMVKAATLSGDSLSTTYRFADLNAEAGKVNTISIAMRHPDFKTGFIRIRPQDYADYNADLMLMEDEPMERLHDSSQRRFWLTDPLALKTWENQLRLQLYSAAPAANVDIYANFPSLGIDSVRLVHLDRVEALLDMMVPMTFTQREAQYLDIHGKRVTLPKMTIPSDIEWFVRTDDPFLTRMAALSLKNWNVSLHNWEALWPSLATAPDPKCMRHAIAQMINLALTFDSEEFVEELSAREGEYIDSDIHYTAEEILERISNGSEGCYGLGATNPSSGSNGWGGGWYDGCAPIILKQEYYKKMYPTVEPDTPCNRERECFYHEHAHCLGFTHEGNMTYGGVWTKTIGKAFLRAHAAGKIFFHSPDFVENLPYMRTEAPEWANPDYPGSRSR